ncbi:MAG TPA: tripartite tricarboxylate transporter substrate-binding protein [Burkholderiales bacterium]|nr:tripartite tricarboxylate transporter substrate-binding protein [Burkholderiales bacterium]
MRAIAAALSAVCLSFAAGAFAQDYPSKPIRVLVPFAPGGAVDTTARILTQKMTERLGWQFVVENRPGGNGFIAATAAAKAAPDGYTLLMAHTGEFAVNPALFKDVPYDLDRDFVAITMVSDGPMLYLANAQAPFNNLKELVAAAKAKPDSISWSSAGNGSINHLAGEWLALAAGIKVLHVPYKGGAPAATAVAAGDVQFGVIALPGATPHLKSGRAKVAGITTARKWGPEPAWSTPRDAGLDVDASIWSGLFAPKGAPQAIVDRINAEVRKTLELPDVRSRLSDAGFEAAGMSQADFVARIRKDLERYREIVKAANVKAE